MWTVSVHHLNAEAVTLFLDSQKDARYKLQPLLCLRYFHLAQVSRLVAKPCSESQLLCAVVL